MGIQNTLSELIIREPEVKILLFAGSNWALKDILHFGGSAQESMLLPFLNNLRMAECECIRGVVKM